jgi:hypothetical protein
MPATSRSSPPNHEHRRVKSDPAVSVECAGCGCVVDRGVRVELCPDPDCCCAHLPRATGDASSDQAVALDHAPGADAYVDEPPVRTWATFREALAVVLDRRHLWATTRIAVVVGTVLFAINQLDVVLAGDATATTWIKAAVTYLVPFTVSNLGILAATRRQHR